MTKFNDAPFVIAGKTFASRLIVGTGKYSSHAVMMQAHEASGADMITVAVRRVNISDRSKESLLDYIDSSKYFLLPNTAGCYTADEAVRTARLGREAGLSEWVKLEVIGDERTLFPDNAALAMELGADGVLMNTAIAGAEKPVAMAQAMKHAVIAGRLAYLAGRIPRKMYATASSPVEGMVGR